MEIDRPLRNPITPEAKPFWNGLREHKMLLPKCGACGHVFFYPRDIADRGSARFRMPAPSATPSSPGTTPSTITAVLGC